MTHLRIEQNTITENVTSNVIHKLYETAKAIIDAEEANEVEESQVSLKGNLQVSKAYGDEIDWLEAKFPDLHITAGIRYIKFADDAVYARLSQYLGDGTGITSSDITNANIFSSSNDSNTGYPYFRGNTSITSFNELGQLPQVTTIPNAAFRDTSNLTSIDLSNVTSVGDSSFWSSGITSTDLSSCTTINSSAFRQCTDLTTVILNSSISTISERAFSGCTSLTSIDLSNVTTILSSAFENCTSLTSIDLSSCTNIRYDVFRGCTGLASIIDLSNCTTIGRGAFNGCSNLDITNWDLSNVTKIGTCCFYGCSKLKGTLNLSGVTTFDGIIQELFSGCSGLQKIVIGHLPLALGSNRMHFNRSPFYNCTSLKVVDINQLDGLFFSSNPIFKNTPAFEALIIRNTSQIPAITYDNNTSQALWSTFAESSTPKIYVDDNLYSTYINHADWSDLASHIEPLSNYVES